MITLDVDRRKEMERRVAEEFSVRCRENDGTMSRVPPTREVVSEITRLRLALAERDFNCNGLANELERQKLAHGRTIQELITFRESHEAYRKAREETT